MAKRIVSPTTVAKIVADWRTGEYTQRDLTERHQVSAGTVSKHTKGVAQDVSELVSVGVEYRSGLAEHSLRGDFVASSIESAVAERLRYLAYFNKAAMVLTRAAMQRVHDDPNLPIQDIRHVSEVVARQRDCVLGKGPETTIQISATPQTTIDASKLNIDALKQITSAKYANR